METRKLLVGLSCLTVVGLLLVSCAPAAAPTPVPKAASPVTKAATPAAAPSAQAPAPATTAVSATPKPAANQPRTGGILATAMTSDMPSLDVHQETGLLVQATVQSCYSGLLQYNPADPDKIVGDLAEKWEASPDGTAYTFHLVKGVKFHDGSALTADDIKYSLQRIFDPPKNIQSPRKSTIESIKEIVISDPETVKLTLKFAQGSFLPMLAVGQIAIYSKKIVEAKGDMKKDVVGTGPFIFKDYSLGTIFEVKKNGNYFVKERPYLDGIRFYIVKDDSTKLAAFRTGQVRLMDTTWPSGLRPAHVQIIRRDMPTAIIAKYPSVGSRWLDMVVTIPPFNDVRVRRAVYLAVDRQAAAKVLEEGEADIGTIFVSGSDWALPEAELLKLPGFRQPKDQDIAEAKKLLAEAGFASGFKTKILARSNYTDNLAVLMKEQLAKIGIELELVVQESAVFLDLLNKLAYPMVSHPIGVRMSDPDEFSRYLISTGGQNRIGLKSPDVDALFGRQERAPDLVERKKIVRELDAKLMELCPVVPLYWQRGNIAYWPDVKNYARGNPFSNNKFQEVWLAK